MSSRKISLLLLFGLICWFCWCILQLYLKYEEPIISNPEIETINSEIIINMTLKTFIIHATSSPPTKYINKTKIYARPNTTLAIAHYSSNIPKANTTHINGPMYPWDGYFGRKRYPSIKGQSISYPLTIQQRLEYYLTPKWYQMFINKNNTDYDQSTLNMNRSLFKIDSRNLTDWHFFDRYLLISKYYLSNRKQKLRGNITFCIDLYCLDVLHLINMRAMRKWTKCEYAMQFGDGPLMTTDYPTAIPVFKKTRFSDQENVLLLKLSFDRHWVFFDNVDKYDVSLEEKKNVIFWRGSMTGTGHWNTNRIARYTMVNKYFNYSTDELTIDMAFYRKGQNYERWKKLGMPTDGLIRPPLAFPRALEAKYLVSIHGNDVASNFNWILYSNSVPFVYRDVNDHSAKSHNKKESWTMQGLLKPYVHFVPFTVRDENDDSLMDAYEFCESHPDNCSRIARNGKLWMSQFKNKTREEEIEMKMLTIYCEKMNVFS